MNRLLVIGSMLVCAPVTADLVEADRLLFEGFALDGSTVSAVETPFVDSTGKVGFIGSLADARRFIWYDGGAVFFSDDELTWTLTGGEGTIDVSDTGGFIYSPSASGQDAVYTHDGLLLRDTDPAPGFAGLFNSFNSRPRMFPNGTAVWVAGTSVTAGGSSSGRVMYRVQDTASPVFDIVYATGDLINGFPVTSSGVDFTYGIVDDASSVISEVVVTTGSTANDNHVIVFDLTGGTHSVVAREGSPAGTLGANWDNFDGTRMNLDGAMLIHGDTDAGDTNTDEFIWYNGTFGIVEPAMVDGFEFDFVRAADLDNAGNVAAIWSVGGTSDEVLSYGHGTRLGSSKKILATGDTLDFDGDGFSDGVLVDFNGSTISTPGLELGDDGRICVDVDIDDLAGREYEAVICIDVEAPCLADFNEDDIINTNDFIAFLNAFNANDPSVDLAPPFQVINTSDFIAFLNIFNAGC